MKPLIEFGRDTIVDSINEHLRGYQKMNVSCSSHLALFITPYFIILSQLRNV